VAKSRFQLVLTIVVVGIGLIVAVVVGIFAYTFATAKPLHPDAQSVTSVATAPPVTQWTAAADQGRQFVRTFLAEQNLPGLSIAVGRGGEVVWTEGFGLSDIEKRTPVAPETRFRAGDVSKALTSAAVGLLLEQNKLRLDDEIQTYVPDFPRKQWPVTLRHLMGHVAGFRDDPGDEAYLEPCSETSEGFALFADHDLLFEPGTQYRASSYSWILVSAAVERAAAGESFFTFMRRQIFEPLGMTSTRPDSISEPIANRTTFYFPRFGGDPRYGPQDAREGDHSCYAGGGAFLSTSSDLVRYGMAITGGKLLKPETVTLLQTEQQLKSGEKTGYGLGWTIEDVPLGGSPARMVGHGVKGDFIGGTAYLMTFPDRGLVVAAMTNTSFADLKPLARHIAEVFAQPSGK
jgi:CubicO group peptidase (beta-lactamase class C family)